MKPLDRLGTDYIEIMERTVLDFIGHLSKSPKYTDRDYDLFHPSFGGVEGQAPVMLVGQATNGWKFSDLSFDLSLIDSKPLIHRAREWLNTQDPGEYGPLDWVNKDWGKGPFRSFLWQVGYKVVNRYMGNPLDSDEWCNSVVWSNLAKIAPRHGGNPDPLEWDAQLSGTVELFRH